MNRKGLFKIGLFGLLIVVIFLAILLMSTSSAITQKKEYVLGEKVKINLKNYQDYKLKIATPSANLIKEGSKDVFIFNPEQVGTYSLEIITEKATESYKFEVIDNQKITQELEVEEKIKTSKNIENKINNTEKIQSLKNEETKENNTESTNNSTKDQFIRIGENVKWQENITTQSDKIKIKIPKKSINISVFENGQNIGYEVKEGIFPFNILSDEKEIVAKDIDGNLLIEYYTEGPEKEEKILEDRKEVTIKSDIHYENILAHTTVEEILGLEQKDSLEVYWKEKNTFLEFQAFDTNNNQLIDYIEWIVPHLSEQTFEITIQNYEVFNFSDLNEKDYLLGDRIKFNLRRMGGYELIIKTPSRTYSRIGSNDFFILELEELGQYQFELIRGGRKTEHRLNVISETEQGIIQEKAEIGKPVRWKGKIKNKTIQIPDLINFSLKDSQGNSVNFSLTEIEEKNFIEVLDNINGEIELEYYTEAPKKQERKISQNKKEVMVSSPEGLHYQNVTAYTNITEITDDANLILVYWKEENTFLDFKALDTNNNQLIDYIEWIVPHLSEQTFEIIVITKAEHLDENRTFIEDIFEFVTSLDNLWSPIIPSGHYVRVTFEKNLTSNNDITIYPNITSGNPYIEIYEKDGLEKIAEFTNIISNQYNKVFLTNLTGTQDTFDLLILGGSIIFDHIIDPSIPLDADPGLDVSLAALDNTTLVAAWIDDTNTDFFFQVFDTNGTNLTDEVSVATDADGTGSRISVTAINETTFIVAWTDNGDGSENSEDAMAAWYSRDGSTVVSPFELDGDLGNSGANYRVDISIAVHTSNSRYYVCHADDQDNDLDAASFSFSTPTTNDGDIQIEAGIGPAGTEGLPFAECTTINSTLSVGAYHDDGGGGCTDSDSIVFGTFDSSGTTSTCNVLDSDVNAGGNDEAVAVTGLNQDRFSVLWTDRDGGDANSVELQIIGDDGTTISGPTTIDSDFGNTDTTLALATVRNSSDSSQDYFIAAWNDRSAGDIRGILYNSTGSQKAGPFVLASDESSTYLNFDIYARDHVNDVGICPGTFSFVYTNSTSDVTINTFYINGTEWDGSCGEAKDTIPPDINFTVPPTPANDTTTPNTTLQFNISIDSDNGLNQTIWNWNGTNYTIFNTSQSGYGLQVMYNFNNVSALGENETNNVTVDISNEGLNGTCINMGYGCNWTAGRYGAGIYFDGSNDQVNASNLTVFDSINWTFASWIKNDLGNGEDVIYGEGNSGSAGFAYITVDNANTFSFRTDEGNVASSSTLTADQWHHIAVTKEGTSIKLYLDGKQDNSGTLSYSQSTNLATIGALRYQSSSNHGPFEGTIDEVQAWTTLFTDQEVYQLYASNLRKYSNNNWSLYINQSQNASDELIDGTYTYFACATDSAGNENCTRTDRINISVPDTTSPSINITFPFSNNTNSSDTGLNVNFTVSDSNLGSCWYSNDTYSINRSTPCGTNLTNITWTEGKHNITVYVNDTAGNLNFSTISFTINTASINVSFTQPPTPINGTITSNTSLMFNVSISIEPGFFLNQTIWNWNGTNYTIFNTSQSGYGLQAMYNLNNVSDLGENETNNIVVDISNEGNNATCINMGYGCNWTAGRYGLGIHFDGVNDQVNASNLSVFNRGNWTFASWIKNDLGNGEDVIYGEGNTGSAGFAYITVDNANTFSFRTDEGNVASSSTLTADQWHHIAVTRNANNVSLYLDGRIDDSGSLSFTQNTNLATIGALRYQSSNNYAPFEGTIDEVQIWSSLYVPEEIYQLYASNFRKYSNNNWSLYVNQSQNTSDGLIDGTYTYFSWAKESSGNENMTEIRSISVDTTPPNGTLISPVNESILNNATQNLTVNATDNIGLGNATFYIYNSTDDLINQTTTTISGTDYLLGVIYEFLYDGVFRWFYRITDIAGNTFDTSNNTITIDTVNPNVSIVQPQNKSYTATSISINFTASDPNLDSCWYSDNGGTTNTTLASCANTTYTANLGSTTITVYANDSAGNLNNSESITFFVTTPWWNNSYIYRKRLNVTVGANEPFNNYSGYTVQIQTNTSTLVSAGKMQADADDLRIIYYNGSDSSELDRIVIDNNTEKSLVRFQLQANITVSGSDDNYYMYYGASSVSNPPTNQSNVYLWYDNASVDRESLYTQGRVDSTCHGGSNCWADSIAHNSSGHYDFDTQDNGADSLRPTGFQERDVYVEYEAYQSAAYDNEMTSGPITRWNGTGSGTGEDSDHFYYYSIGDSDIDTTGPYDWHDDILEDGRHQNNVVVANGGSDAFPTNFWTRLGMASWGINPTSLAAWYNETINVNDSGGWLDPRFNGTHDSADDNEDRGEVGFWLQQDAGRIKNILIRRYTYPEPSLNEKNEESISNAPTIPDPNLPVNGSASNIIIEINWSNSTDLDADPISYIFIMDNNSDFSSPEYYNGSIPEETDPTGVTPTGITEDGEYFWKVRATDNLLNSSWSPARTFYYDTTAPNVTLLLPFNNTANTTSNTINFTYNVTDLTNITSCSFFIDGVINGSNNFISRGGENSFSTYLNNGIYLWNVSCVDSAGNTGYSFDTRTINVSVTNQVPIAHEIQCEQDNSTWNDCSSVTFGYNITKVRLRCTDNEGAISNVTFNFTNLPDSKNFFYDTTTTNESDYWIYDNNDIIINDSGNFTLSANCIDNSTLQDSNTSTWLVPWGTLVVNLISPNSNTNVQKGKFFNFTVNISCEIGECGNSNITLDPTNWWNNSYLYRKQLNVTVGANEPFNNYSGYTVQLTINTSTLVSAGKMQADADDLRIVYYNGSDNSELDRIVIDNNTEETLIRFKLQTNITASTTDQDYYIYYGESSAINPPNNESKVYLWYDNASVDRESLYTQGRVDSSAHGGGFADSFSHNIAGYYDFDTTDNNVDSLRPTGLHERDVYVEAEEYQTDAYPTDMSSGPITRWNGTGSGASEDSDHFYYYVFGDSSFRGGSYPAHDDVTSDDRSTVIIANGALGDFPGNSWTRYGMASWGINPTNIAAWYNESPVSNNSGGWISNRFNNTHAAASDNEDTGEVGLWIQQDQGRIRNILIRRYTYPEPILVDNPEEIVAKGIVSTVEGTTPFYTIDANPMDHLNNSCLQSMTDGRICEITWQVNATGETGLSFEFFSFPNATNYSDVGENRTSIINITIVSQLAPTIPSLNLPLNGTSSEGIGEFNWSNSTDANADAIYYVFVMDNNSDFSSPEYYNGSIPETDNTTEVFPTGITSAGAYYWRVLATDLIDNSSWSETRIFYYDTDAPNLTFINQTGEDNLIINQTHILDESENITIFVNVIDVLVDSVKVIVWLTVKGGTEFFEGFFSDLGNNLWKIVIPTNSSWNNTQYNYTIYANDTTGNESEYDGNFSVLHGKITVDLNPSSVNSSTNVTISGKINMTNGTTLPNYPINIWLNNTLYLYSNLTANGLYQNFQNFSDTLDTDFDKGTYTNTESDGQNVTLSTGSSSGNFTKIFDAGAIVQWNYLTFTHSGASCSGTVTYQEGDSNNYSQTHDTYISSGSTSTNYGTENSIVVDNSPNTERGIIRFGNVVGRAFNQIPENSTILEANMTIAISDSGNLVNIYAVLENWTEDQATYDDRLTSTAWGSAGLAGGPSRSTDLQDSINPSSTGNFTFNVTNAVENWVNGSYENLGIVIDPTAGNGISIRSSEYSQQSQRPKLSISYSANECTSTIVYIRTSNDKSSWTDWQQIDSGDPINDPNPFNASRYLEYRVELTSINNTLSPTFQDIFVNYTAVVTNATGDYSYNLTNPSDFGTYPIAVNTSLRTIKIHNSSNLSVQSGVAPTVSLVSPANATWFNYSNITFTYNATDANNDFVNSTLILDGTINKTNQTAILNGLNNNFTQNLSSGGYNWTVNITDATGLIGNTSIRTFYVDLENPNTSLLYPTNNSNFTIDNLNLSFNATDNMDNALVCDIVLDGSTIYSSIGAISGNITNRSTGSLSSGIHSWNVTCVDESNRSFVTPTYRFNISDTPPTISLVYPEADYIDSDGDISFVFNATDNNGFTNATLMIDNSTDTVNQTSINNGLNTTINRTSLSEGKYNWSILVIDLGGISVQSSQRPFSVDLNPPTINLSGPLNNSNSSSADVSFNFTVNDIIDSSLLCNLTINSAVVDANFTATAGALTNRNVNDLTDGLKIWNVTCIDDALHTNTSQTWYVNVSEAPNVTLNTANETSFNSSVFNLSYTPTDNTDLSSCDLYIGGVFNQSNSSEIYNGAINNFSVSGFSDGTYTWAVNCTDYIGLNFQTPQRTFFVDFAGPNVTLHYPNEHEINSQNITFNFTVIDDIDTSLVCNLSVDSSVVDANFTAINGSVTDRVVSDITDGFHTWHVNCTDSALNVGNSLIFNFTKSTPPTITLQDPPNGTWFNTAYVNLTYFPQDDEGVNISYLFINEAINLTNQSEIINGANNSFNLSGFGDGFYNWTVLITDARNVNNTASPNRTFYIDTQAPQLILNQPNGSDTITTNNVSFNFTVSDNLDPLLSCQLFVDGESEYNSNSTNGTDVLNYVLVADGFHEWNVTCFDEAGNYNYSQTINFTLEAPPNVSLITVNNISIIEEVYLNATATTFVYLPEDPIGIFNCSIYIDDVYNDTDSSITANQNNNFTVNNIPEGFHNWTVECADAAPDYNTFRASVSNFTIDRSPPSPLLVSPENNTNVLRQVSFNFTVSDNLDPLLECNLYSDGILNISSINVTNGSSSSHTISGFSLGLHTWNVSCLDNSSNINWSQTWQFNVTLADLMVNTTSINFNNTNPIENETIRINATIYNLVNVTVHNVTVQFYDGNPNSNGIQIGSNQTINSISGLSEEIASLNWKTDLGNSEIFVIVDPPLSENGTIEEFIEINNNASRNITIGGWHFFFGNISLNSVYRLADNDTYQLLEWSASNFRNGSVFVADSESIISWSDLEAIGKNISGENSTGDFAEIDLLLNMTDFNDSISTLYTDSGIAKNTSNFTIFQKIIDQVPVADSINNSNFVTGILWDASDDTDGEFNQTDKEDLVFAAKVNKNKQGAYGAYDYELRVPARLREYDNSNSLSVVFYIEIF